MSDNNELLDCDAAKLELFIESSCVGWGSSGWVYTEFVRGITADITDDEWERRSSHEMSDDEWTRLIESRAVPIERS